MDNQEKKVRNSNPDYPDGILFFPKKPTEKDWKYGKLIFYPEDIIDFCKKHPEQLTEYKGRKQLKLEVCRTKTATIDKPEAYLKVDKYEGGQSEPQVSVQENDDDLFKL